MTEVMKRDLTWARKITERLRLQATNYQEARDKIRATIAEAQEGDAAGLLGYASWTAYAADVLGDAPLRLERDERRELVQELAQTGMSTRAIAPIVGVGNKTVHRDLQAGVSNDTPAPRPTERVEVSREVIPGDPGEGDELIITFAPTEPEPKRITGLDGKTYKAPEAKKPNRRPLTDAANDAGWNLRKAMERIERIREDDRFSRNKEEVATLLRGHLTYVIETCQGILDDFDQSKED